MWPKKMSKNHHGCHFSLENYSYWVCVNLHRKSPYFNLMLRFLYISFRFSFSLFLFVRNDHSVSIKPTYMYVFALAAFKSAAALQIQKPFWCFCRYFYRRKSLKYVYIHRISVHRRKIRMQTCMDFHFCEFIIICGNNIYKWQIYNEHFAPKIARETREWWRRQRTQWQQWISGKMRRICVRPHGNRRLSSNSIQC